MFYGEIISVIQFTSSLCLPLVMKATGTLPKLFILLCIEYRYQADHGSGNGFVVLKTEVE